MSKAHWYRRADKWFDWPRRRVPIEIAALRVVNKSPTCPYIIPYEGFRLLSEVRGYRIATPVADFGDMTYAIKSWIYTSKKKYLPKAFLFDCFSALVKAGKFMVDRNMLHNDLKHVNVLMVADAGGDMREFAHETDEKAIGWGIKPVITDFGLARPMESKMFNNPLDLIGFGTKSFRPPEQCRDEETGLSWLGPRKVGEKAVVFALGCIMFWVGCVLFIAVQRKANRLDL
jgi:serine/threonine protein kinase